MSNIEIPQRFKKKFSESSFIYKLIKNVEPLLKKVPFFPEYTMHDASHINEVLKIANELIPNSTLKKLDSDALEILVGAITIHDLGMFI